MDQLEQMRWDLKNMEDAKVKLARLVEAAEAQVKEVSRRMNDLIAKQNAHKATWKDLELDDLEAWALESAKLETIYKAYNRKYGEADTTREKIKKELVDCEASRTHLVLEIALMEKYPNPIMRENIRAHILW